MPRDVEIGESCGFGGDHCLAPSRSVDALVDGASGRYERLFPQLAALEGEGDALLALGTAGGICDGGESCQEATETAAGWPLFGQFIAHDITADRSPLTHRAELSDAVNFRSPRADSSASTDRARSVARSSTAATTRRCSYSVATTGERRPTCRETPRESR